jgi:endonuclease/exonuclease/phosphatase family metal-dependent hydrolase
MKVLSYNIRMGGEDRLPDLGQIIRKAKPDVVALLEANSLANAERLANTLSMHLTFGESNGKFHVAWLSHLPVLRSENHRLPILAKTLLEIVVLWKGGMVRLFATHLASSHDRVQPVEEVVSILDLLSPLAGEPHLLVGDFNSLAPGDPVGTPPPGVEAWGDAARNAPRHTIGLIMGAGYVDCYRSLHPRSPGYTYPANQPWLRLDYVFASPPMAARLTACEVIRTMSAKQASDHFPIWAEFS